MPNDTPLLGSKLVSRLAANGIRVLEKTDSVAKPISNIYGIDETKEVATVLCGFLNVAVNKGNLSDYLSLLPSLYAGLKDISKVDDEMLDMITDEVIELHDHIKEKLNFVGEANAYEEVVEDLIVYTVGIVKTIIRTVQINKQLESEDSVG